MDNKEREVKDYLEEAIKLLYGSETIGYAVVSIAQELRLIRQQIGAFFKSKEEEYEGNFKSFYIEPTIKSYKLDTMPTITKVNKLVEVDLEKKDKKEWEQLEFDWDKK